MKCVEGRVMATITMDDGPPRASDFATVDEALTAAVAMFGSGDHAVALRLWAQIREFYPTNVNGFLAAAAGLAQLDRTREADELLADGQARFPQDPNFVIERGRLARRAGDPTAAAALFAALRITAPNEIAGYLDGAACLRDLGRFAVAEGILRDALARFPTEPEPAMELARLFEARADWQQALIRWSAASETFPGEYQGYLGMSRALVALDRRDEADAVLTQAIARLPADVDLLVAHAWAAEQRDMVETLRRLEAARSQFPDDPSPHFGIGAVLRDLGRFDEADAVFAKTLERFPEHLDVLVNYARVAQERGEWAEAARRWELVEAAQPDLADGYLGHAAALAEAGRIDEADALLAKAMLRFPANPDVLMEHARTALSRKDWQQALGRWEAVRAHFPERIADYAQMGVALRELGRFDDADALLRDATERYPEDADISVNYAWVAYHRGDWPEAVRRWDNALKRFPDDPSPWFGKGAALRDLAHFDEADATFVEALQRFPDHEDVLVNYARVAQERGDWSEALLRWEAVCARFPEHEEAMAGRDAALAVLSRDETGGTRAAGTDESEEAMNGLVEGTRVSPIIGAGGGAITWPGSEAVIEVVAPATDAAIG